MKRSTRRGARFFLENTFWRLVLVITTASILMYIVSSSPVADILIGAQKSQLMRIFRAMGFSVIDTAPRAFIVYGRGEPHVLTLILTLPCTGVYMILVYSLLALAVPEVTTRYKSIVIALGSSIIVAANTLRLITATIIGLRFGYVAFKYFHDIIGGAAMLILATSLWVDWLYRVHRHGRWP